MIEPIHNLSSAESKENKAEEDIPKVTIEIPEKVNDTSTYFEGQDWLDPVTGTPF